MRQSQIVRRTNSSTATATFLYNSGRMNLYRITVRDKDGKLSDRETRAVCLFSAVEDLDGKSEVVKVERIHPSTGEVLGGYYNE